jgi:hypothetical protein
MNSDKIIDISEWLRIVRQRVESLSYGSVEITIHDSKIVELDTTKRLRLYHRNSQPEREKAKRPRLRHVSSRSGPVNGGSI